MFAAHGRAHVDLNPCVMAEVDADATLRPAHANSPQVTAIAVQAPKPAASPQPVIDSRAADLDRLRVHVEVGGPVRNSEGVSHSGGGGVASHVADAGTNDTAAASTAVNQVRVRVLSETGESSVLVGADASPRSSQPHECPVCADVLNEFNVVLLPCHHAFCREVRVSVVVLRRRAMPRSQPHLTKLLQCSVFMSIVCNISVTVVPPSSAFKLSAGTFPSPGLT